MLGTAERYLLFWGKKKGLIKQIPNSAGIGVQNEARMISSRNSPALMIIVERVTDNDWLFPDLSLFPK